MVTRWYAPALGRFISEDSLLGTPADPASRQLYAYGEGESVGRWDPDGRDPWRTESQRGTCGGYECLWIPAASSHQNRCDRYWRYDSVLRYMLREMRENARESSMGVWRTPSPWFIDTGTAMNDNMVLAKFGSRVRTGGPWDHKPELRKHWGRGFGFYTPIRGDGTLEAIYYDIWSNIHYGYVGRAHNIPRGWLQDAQYLSGGTSSASDDLSVRIGMDLWESQQFNVSATDVQGALLRHMAEYRRYSSWRDREVVNRHPY